MDIKNTTAPCICWHYPVSEKFLKIGENFARLQARTWLSRALSSSFTIMVMSLWSGPLFLAQHVYAYTLHEPMFCADHTASIFQPYRYLIIVSRPNFAREPQSAKAGFYIPSGSRVGLPDLPYFTGHHVFQTLSSVSRGGGSHREEQISRILLVRLSRHSDDNVKTRENFV